MTKASSGKSTRILITLALLAFGVISLVLGGRNIKNRTTFEPATATITDIQFKFGAANNTDEHRVYVSYTYNGETYSAELGEYRADYSVGKEVDILVDPQNPRSVQTAGWLSPILTCAVGVGALLLGLRSLKELIEERKKSEWQN